ncbi:MAG TPA: OsmC family peroxiredoxin [Candidatus Dormibacteraeota bacterium]|nr:OsmC family peroxiredoxin [Candidatus Dormibacteraeota bacterium]
MTVRTARASWAPSAEGGGGNIRTESGTVAATYSRGSRFASDPGTNPEELLGAAHAACFNLALAGALTGAGHPPDRLETEAAVTIEKLDAGFRITTIHLNIVAEVPGLSDEQFQEHAHRTKLGCPVSVALAGTDIFLEAKLV